MTGHTRKPAGNSGRRGSSQPSTNQHWTNDAQQQQPYGRRDANQDASQYTGRRRAASADYGSPSGDEAPGRRLTDSGRDRRGLEHEATQRSAGRPRTPGRRRAPIDDSARPHLFGRLAKAGPVALAMAVGGAVAAFAAPSHAPAAQLSPAPQCELRLPDQPLTAQGLATPFVLSGVGGQACHESDPNFAAFAQGLILDPATGQLAVYDPLVIDEGTQPAVAPTVPTLPANAIVALWFGFNGNVLALSGGTQAGSCVNGSDNSPFGQFSYCNAPALFAAANAAISQGKIAVPPIGTAADGKPCLTTRDFGLVDQDQSDNVTSTYLVLSNGTTAQNTQAAAKKLAGKQPSLLANGSDNLLLDHFVDPALGCKPWTAPDLASPGFQATALGLNELQAAAHQAAPVAIVPLNDPMTLDGSGATSDAKTDLYRAGVDQPPLAQVPGSAAQYCANLRTIGVTRTKLDRSLTDTTSSPDPAAASDLFTFLGMRLQQSYVNLGCEQLLGESNPVHLKTDANGVVVDATFDHVGTGGPTPSPSASAVASPSPSASPKPSTSPSASAAPTAGTTTSPATVTPSHAPPPPPPSTPANPSTTQAQGPGGNVPTHGPSAAAPPSASKAAPPTQPTTGKPTSQAAAPGSGGSSGSGSNGAGDNSTGSGAAGSGSGPDDNAAAGSKPIPTVVTSTPISVAGFEHAHAAAAQNPNSALSGPDPMANSGFSIMSARTLWALGGALLVLGASLLYRRRPRRSQSRRGTSS